MYHAGATNTQFSRQVSYQPRIPTRGQGDQQQHPVYDPPRSSRPLHSIPPPKVRIEKSSTVGSTTDAKRTPLLSRLLPPGFASTGSSPDGSSSTASVQTVRTADGSEPHYDRSNDVDDKVKRTDEALRFSSGDRKPIPQRYKPRAARFAPSNSSGGICRPSSGSRGNIPDQQDTVALKNTNVLTVALQEDVPSYYDLDPTDPGDQEYHEDITSSPCSGSTVPSTTESQDAFSEKHGYESDQAPEQRLSSEEGDREALRCSADEGDIPVETGSKTDNRSPDSDTQLTLCAPEVSGFPKMFHRIPHAYVNDEQALAAAEMDGDQLFYTGYEAEFQPEHPISSRLMFNHADNNDTSDTRSDLPCGAPQISYPTTVIVEPQAPLLHPKQTSFSRMVRTRSQPNLSRDYVNLPEDSLVNWLTTTVTSQYPFGPAVAATGYFPNADMYAHRRKRSSVQASEDTMTPSISLPPPPPPPLLPPPPPPPPPPPYRPHTPMLPRIPTNFMTPRQTVGGNVLCHLANGSFCYAPFQTGGGSFTVISTTATTACHAPTNLLYFHPNWLFARPFGPGSCVPRAPIDQVHERPPEAAGEHATQETDASTAYLHQSGRSKPSSNFGQVPRFGAPVGFVISTTSHEHLPRFPTVSGRAMPMPSDRGPAPVCDSLLGSSKLESASATAGQGVSDSSPSIQNVPGEIDVQALWKENQQLRVLLHEATSRLQYVNVLECHLQRLNMLVGSMLASHHRQCELDHQLHGCPHQEHFPAESRSRPAPPPSQGPPSDWVHPLVPNSLPAAPIIPYYQPGYYPFNIPAPTVVPERTIPIGPVQPGWNVRPQMMYAADRSGRSTRSRVNTSAWPRTVSLDRADGVGGCASGCNNVSPWTGTNVQSERTPTQSKKQMKQKTVRVADAAVTFAPGDRSPQPLPFRSVQLTRRRLDHSAPVPTPKSSARITSACESHHCSHAGRDQGQDVKYQLPVSNPSRTARPMDISVINRYPDIEEQDAVKNLTPHTETLPVKIAVSSVYQIASACRVCLADSGVHSGDSQTQLAPVGHPAVTSSTNLPNTSMPSQTYSSFQSSTAGAVHSSTAGDGASHCTLGNADRETPGDSRPVQTNAATEPDGSGSYEGITLPRPTHSERAPENVPTAHSTTITTSMPNTEPFSTCAPSALDDQFTQVHFARHTTSHKPRFTSQSFTPQLHSPQHASPVPRSKRPDRYTFPQPSPEVNYAMRSPGAPPSTLHQPMAFDRFHDPSSRVELFPGYCFGGSSKVNEVLIDADSRYTQYPHRPNSHITQHHSPFPSSQRSPGLQVHFAPRAGAASHHPADKHIRNFIPSEQNSNSSCNFPLDSIVSPHLLRKHYCYDQC